MKIWVGLSVKNVNHVILKTMKNAHHVKWTILNPYQNIEKSFERDPDPRPLPYQGNALPGWAIEAQIHPVENPYNSSLSVFDL